MTDKTGRTGRRRVLKATACGLLVGGSTGTAAGQQTDDVDPTVVFDDQTTDGDTIVLEEVRSDRSSSLFVTTRQGETVAGEGVRFAAGDVVEDLALPLERSLEESQSLLVSLYESNGGPIAENSAQVTVEGDAKATGPAGRENDDGASDDEDTSAAFTLGNIDWPGISQIGAIASIGSAAYLLKLRTRDEGESSSGQWE